MKISIAIAIVVIVLSVGTFLRVRKQGTQPRKFASTDEFVQWLAEEAVKDARQQNHIELDYSVESIKRVEQVLGGLHDQYVKNPASISAKGLGSAYGAYVGEVIRRTEPGAKWDQDHPVGGEKSYPISWGNGQSFPMAWCYHRIVNGPEDDVWVKYRALKDQRSNAMTSGEK